MVTKEEDVISDSGDVVDETEEGHDILQVKDKQFGNTLWRESRNHLPLFAARYSGLIHSHFR